MFLNACRKRGQALQTGWYWIAGVQGYEGDLSFRLACLRTANNHDELIWVHISSGTGGSCCSCSANCCYCCSPWLWFILVILLLLQFLMKTCHDPTPQPTDSLSPPTLLIEMYWARYYSLLWVAWNWVKKIALSCLMWVNKTQIN